MNTTLGIITIIFICIMIAMIWTFAIKIIVLERKVKDIDKTIMRDNSEDNESGK